MKIHIDEEILDKSLKENIQLSDGSFHRMFKCLLQNRVWFYLCLPCGVTCMGRSGLWSHAVGKRHRCQILSCSIWPETIITDHPYYKLNDDNGNANNASVSNGPSDIAPNQPLVVATDKPSVGAPNTSSVDAPNTPLTVAPNKPMDVAPNKPLIVATNKPSAVAPNKSLVVATDKPSVVAPIKTFVVAPKKPLVIDTNEPSVVAPNKPSVVTPNQSPTITPNKLAPPVSNESLVNVLDESKPPKVETPSQLEECIPVKGKSIVGLEYFLEIVDDKKEPTYFCALCKVSSNSQTVLEHIQGFSHKLEYLSAHYPRPFRALHNIAGKHLQAGKVQVVENICNCIEKAYGRLKPLVVSLEKFHKNRSKYLKKVNESKHFTGADGGSFEELVDEEYIITISKMSDDKNMNSAISFDDVESTYDSISSSDNEELINEEKWDKSENNKMDENQEKKSHRRRISLDSISSLSDISSIFENDDHIALDSAKHDKKKSSQKKIKTKVNSTKCIGNKSTRKLKDSSRISKNGNHRGDLVVVDLTAVEHSENEKWEEYQSKMKIICNDIKSQYKFFENHPEQHPRYGDEWRKFWTKRCQQLKIENKDINSIDLIPEWIQFWSEKMMDKYNEDLAFERQKILKDSNLPIDFDDPIFNYSNCTNEQDPKKIEQDTVNVRNREIDLLKDRDKLKERSREKNRSVKSPATNWGNRSQEKIQRSQKSSQERNKSVESPERNWIKRKPERILRSRERSRSLGSPKMNFNKIKAENNLRSQKRSRERNQSVESPERKRNKRSHDRDQRIHEKSRSVRTPESNRNKRSRERELLNKSKERSRSNRSLERGRNTRSPKSNRNIKSREKSFDRGTSWNRREDRKRELETNKFHDIHEKDFQIRRYHSPLRSSPHKEHLYKLDSESYYNLKKSWNLFNSKFDYYANEIKKKYIEYEEEPQLHPDYKEEYIKFMDKQKNKFKNGNEMKIEWFKYWSKRVRELKDRDMNHEKQTMMKDFGLSLDQVRDFRNENRKYDKLISNDKKKLKPMDPDKLNVLSVLRHLTALENYLGSLGPKVVDLLGVVLKMEKEKQNSSNEILSVDEYCVLLETVREKIKGQLLADLIEPHVKQAAKLAITYTNALLQKASVIEKMHIKLTQDEKFTKNSPEIAINISPVEKAAIATEIAAVLMTQGKRDVTTEELETLINAVVGMANASQNPSTKPLSGSKLLIQLAEIRNKASQAKKSTNFASILNIMKSPQDEQLMHSDSKISGLWERNSSFVDKLSDSDLKTLLQNFRNLSTVEQQGLMRYLKQLEFSNPTKFENLKKFINIDTSILEQFNKLENRRSGFSSECCEGIPSQDKEQHLDVSLMKSLKNINNDDKGYNYERMTSTTKNVKLNQFPKKIDIMKNTSNTEKIDTNINCTTRDDIKSNNQFYNTNTDVTNTNSIANVLNMVMSTAFKELNPSQISSSISGLPNCIDSKSYNINNDSIMNSINIQSSATSSKMQSNQCQNDQLQDMRIQRNQSQSTQLKGNNYQQLTNKTNMPINPLPAKQKLGKQMQINNVHDNRTQSMQGNQIQSTSTKGNHIKNMFGENSNQICQIQNSQTVISINQMQCEQFPSNQIQGIQKQDSQIQSGKLQSVDHMQGGSKIGSQMQFGNTQGGQMQNSPMPYQSSLIDQLHNIPNKLNSRFNSLSKFSSNSSNTKLNTFPNQNKNPKNVSTFGNKSNFNSISAPMSNLNSLFGNDQSICISGWEPITKSRYS